MARGELLAIAVLAVTIALATCQEDQTKPISKCWKCSSNAQGVEFCNDPFDGDKLNETQKALYYINCPAPPNREAPQLNQRNVCRKLKQIENGTVVVHRGCFWQESDKSNERPCENNNLPSYITVESCELCDGENGCNSAVQYGPIVIFMAIPMLIAKMLF